MRRPPSSTLLPYTTLCRSVKALVDAAKASPGRLTFGHAGIGSQTHLAAENFLYQAKADAVSVPYKGEGPARAGPDRKSTRLNSSPLAISYAVFRSAITNTC